MQISTRYRHDIVRLFTAQAASPDMKKHGNPAATPRWCGAVDRPATQELHGQTLCIPAR